MSNLPRRPVEPLAPPPDAFDRVLTTARRRRRSRGVIAASSTMVVVLIAAASVALGASQNVSQPNVPANRGTSHDNPAPKPRPQMSPSPTSRSKDHARTVTSKPGVTAISWLRGRAVDSGGNGISGLYVLPGRVGMRTFNSGGGTGTRTDGRGYFKIVCPHAPVLLSSWRINQDYSGGTIGGQWGATFVGSTNGDPVVPRCGLHSSVTTLSAGATVTGHVNDTGSCVPGDDYHVWLWLGGNHGTTIRLVGLHSGDAFTYSGLPAGTHTLGLRGQTKSVPLASGATVEANVDFACDKQTPTTPATETTAPPVSPSQPPTGAIT